MFGYILGVVALTVSEWSALSRLIAVTFLSLMSWRFPATPDVSIPGLKEELLLICIFWVLFSALILHRCPMSS
jgi:hypothetical protein